MSEPTGVILTPITQTEPIDTYVKFLKINESVLNSPSKNSDSNEESDSSESESCSETSIAETILVNVQKESGISSMERNDVDQSLKNSYDDLRNNIKSFSIRNVDERKDIGFVINENELDYQNLILNDNKYLKLRIKICKEYLRNHPNIQGTEATQIDTDYVRKLLEENPREDFLPETVGHFRQNRNNSLDEFLNNIADVNIPNNHYSLSSRTFYREMDLLDKDNKCDFRYCCPIEETGDTHPTASNFEIVPGIAHHSLFDSGLMGRSFRSDILPKTIDKYDQKQCDISNTISSRTVSHSLIDLQSITSDEMCKEDIQTSGRQLESTDNLSITDCRGSAKMDYNEMHSKADLYSRKLWESTIRLPKKSCIDHTFQENFGKQVKYTSWDNLFDVTFDVEESVVRKDSQTVRQMIEKIGDPRYITQTSNKPNIHPIVRKDFKKKASFSMPAYLSEIRRIYERKPSTRRTKEFLVKGSLSIDFDFEDYCKKILDLHKKHKSFKDIITKVSSPQ